MDYKKIFKNDKNITIQNATNDSISYIIHNIFNCFKNKFLLYVVKNNFEIELIKNEINFYSKDIEIIEFPEWNTMFFDVNSPQLKIQTKRMETLYNLINNKKNKGKILFLITEKAIMQKVVNKKEYKYINLSIGTKASIKDIEKKLKENCYFKVETSFNVGDYSVNNNVVDLITFNKEAYRIILKNDIITEIKEFNPKTQIAEGGFENILILPIKEVIFNENNIKNFKMNYIKFFDIQNKNDLLYENISNNNFYNGCENWLPLFYNNELSNIFDYLQKDISILFNFDFYNNIKIYQENIEKNYQERLNDLNKTNIYNPLKPELLYLSNKEILDNIKNYQNIIFDIENKMQDDKDIAKLNFKNTPNFFENSKEVFSDLKKFIE